MNTLGLVGFPVSHSKSPQIFHHFFETLSNPSDWEYKLFPLEHIENLPELLKNESNLRGFNVTLPHKQSILPFLHEIDNSALQCGAANTILLNYHNKNLHLTGYNTDVFGFEKALMEFVNPLGHKALVLGSGGSSKAVIAALNQLNIAYVQVSRTPSGNMIGYSELGEDTVKSHSIIVNTTSLGMTPHIDTFPPIPYKFISKHHYCFDLVYNPAETQFMKLCSENGAHVCNGLSMLQYQADAAWSLFVKNGI